MAFELMNKHKFEINTTPGTEPGSMAAIAVGITNVAMANNEELSQDKYLDGAGFGETDVIGAQTVLTFTGHRNYEDEAMKFIMGLMLELGTSRRTNFVWTEPDGGKFEGECTIANIQPGGGDAGSKSEISFEIHFNGKPEYTSAV